MDIRSLSRAHRRRPIRNLFWINSPRLDARFPDDFSNWFLESVVDPDHAAKELDYVAFERA